MLPRILLTWTAALSTERWRPRLLLRLAAVGLVSAIVGGLAWAQPADEPEEKPAPKPKVAAKQPKPRPAVKDEKEIDTTPVELGGNELMTKDGVQLRATYFRSAKGRESVPVVLLHGLKGDRKDFLPLAKFLQDQGYTAIVPDLRGHGESIHTAAGVKLDATKLPPDQVRAMVEQDLETVKNLLVAKNNAEELNLSKLCVIGAELGALVALNWARYDWTSLTGERPPMHVKALVLISPPWSMSGLDARGPLTNEGVRKYLSVMILVGAERPKEFSNAKQIYNFLSRYHPEPDKPEDKDLFSFALPTKLEGTKMLGVKIGNFNVEQMINQFIEVRLARQSRPELNWRKRGEKGR